MAHKRNNPTTDVYELVTSRVLEQLENGVIPWQKPWHGGLEGAISYTTGRPYSLLNQLILGKEGEYLTFKQVKELGGKVKEGAKSQMVVFFKLYPTKDFRKKKNEQGEEEMEEVQKMIPVLRYYNVFHIDDCEGVKSKLNGEKPVCTLKPVEQAEKVIADGKNPYETKLLGVTALEKLLGTKHFAKRSGFPQEKAACRRPPSQYSEHFRF